MNYAKAKQECTYNHDVYITCPGCGWMRPTETLSRASEWGSIAFLYEMQHKVQVYVLDCAKANVEPSLKGFVTEMSFLLDPPKEIPGFEGTNEQLDKLFDGVTREQRDTALKSYVQEKF